MSSSILGLVHPLRHFSRSTRKARVYTIPVAIMSFVLVSPEVMKYVFVKSTVSLSSILEQFLFYIIFFKLYLIPSQIKTKLFQGSYNSTKPDKTINEANWDYFYEGYIKWGDLILTSILPIILLSYCTVRIIIVLRRKKSTDFLLGKITSEAPHSVQMKELYPSNNTGGTNNKDFR